MGRFARWLRFHDGVHVSLADRTEVGWYGVEERDSSFLGTHAAETVPEHLHHNYLNTEAYNISKKARGVTAANYNEFGKKGKFSNPDSW